MAARCIVANIAPSCRSCCGKSVRNGAGYRAAISALTADVVNWENQIAATKSLIAGLSARAGIKDGAAGTRGTTHAAREKPAPKRRRRRRHSARRHTSRHSPPRQRRKPDIEPMQVAAPAPIGAKAEPAKSVRGHGKFADQLAELELVRVGIAAAGDDAKIIHTLQVRGDAALREMAGKAKLPSWCSKSLRMQWRRAAKQAETAPRTKKPRKKTPAPVPPVKRDSGRHDDGNGNLVREIASQ